jgi:hypothetical protein
MAFRVDCPEVEFRVSVILDNVEERLEVLLVEVLLVCGAIK